MEEICDTPAEYWLAETPQALAPRKLGRQSAERERIFGINWNVILRKTVGWTPSEPSLRLGDPLYS
ncbi:hypothetical protein V3595_00570 [Bacillus sp. CFBP9009]